MPRWRLSDLFRLTLFVAIGAAGQLLFLDRKSSWNSPSNQWLVCTAYLVVLSASTLAAVFGRPFLRRFCMGFALFNWIAIFGLTGGSLRTFNDLSLICLVGLMGGTMCGILSRWLLKAPVDPACSKKHGSAGEE
jgi:hypothetical protein